MSKRWIVMTLLVASIVSPYVYSFPQKTVSVADKIEGVSPKDVIADFSWILLLCLFSVLIRFKTGSNSKRKLYLLAFLLLMLAAIHSHPLWSFSKSSSALIPHSAITRIIRVPAVITETGLQLDDIVHSMYFDPGGKLWMSANQSGPYIYSVPTNEFITLLRPDFVYGLYPDQQGMWVLASTGAFLYDGETIVRKIHFPSEIIPLCAGRVGGDLYFGTAKGLYRASSSDRIALHEVLSMRVNHITTRAQGLFLGTENGVWQLSQDRSITAMDEGLPRFNIASLIQTNGQILAATDSKGILQIHSGRRKEIQFGRKAMNLFTTGSATQKENTAYFGAMDGSIVFLEKGKWKRIETGEWTVSALAADGDSIFAWTNGRLIRIQRN